VPRLDESALRLLLDYPWPGNVRELTNALQYALVKTRGALIRAEHLPPELTTPAVRATRSAAGRKPKLTLAQVKDALDKTGGNRVEAARLLGVGRATLYRYL
jgi:transcriptional regulator of acetoin/glycerol metabolism